MKGSNLVSLIIAISLIGIALAVFAGYSGHYLSSTKIGKVYSLNATTGKVYWNFTTMVGSTGGAGVWGSVIGDPNLGSVYFGTGSAYTKGSDTLYAYSIISLNATTGKLKWYYRAHTTMANGDDKDFGSTPNLFSLTVNGTVYNAIGLGSKDGNYYTINRINGTLLEKSAIMTGNAEGGIIGLAGFIYPYGNTNPELFIPVYGGPANNATCCGFVEAFAPSNNSVMWRFNTSGDVFGSVAVIPGAVLFGDNKGNLYAVSIKSGKQLFRTTLNSMIEGGITVAEGHVLVPTSFGPDSVGLYAYSESGPTSLNGGSDWTSFLFDNNDSRYQENSVINSSNVDGLTQAWVIKTQNSITSTPLVLNGSVYFADFGGNIYSANIMNGRINWKTYLGNTPISSTLLLADGKVYAGDGLGQAKVFALNQSNGNLIWITTLETGRNGDNGVWASPTLINGRIYIGVANYGGSV